MLPAASTHLCPFFPDDHQKSVRESDTVLELNPSVLPYELKDLCLTNASRNHALELKLTSKRRSHNCFEQ